MIQPLVQPPLRGTVTITATSTVSNPQVSGAIGALAGKAA